MKIGFLGAGNMACAIVEGIIKKGFVKAEDIYLYDILTDKVAEFAKKNGTQAVIDPKTLVETVDTLVLAVKPNVIKDVLAASKEVILKNDPLIVSIAAGTPLSVLYEVFDTDQAIRIVRVMPNVNALVGEGAAAVCGNEYADQTDVALIIEMFNAVGQAWELSEQYFSNFTALAGSSPAYAYLFIDSIARAGVKNGMAKDRALEIAAQAVLGSAKMIIESQENPWTLIDRVCSPGGTTVAGLVELENNAFISTVIKGIDATIAKDQEMSQS
ncbi:pyrroline-5-carboxylate reductase [Candidatus Enterococcus ikei]|uniref:Pyrroline-5-carboxylate reductase n=1 Tax=Candidatus Enterococcus ikei TaxID=2815326 RepID=A0ABS3GZP1_9ENTE|nr:pyrroline-5-carboxylate reductase [Enterococcus sp. DIV0869a]MBO0440315.1 pyrroline-5-carboxylate reductase [Enterococcus sp. DIV0869a]